MISTMSVKKYLGEKKMKIKEKGTGAMVLGILAIIGGCSICGGFIFELLQLLWA